MTLSKKQKLQYFLDEIYVEPVGFFAFCGFIIFQISQAGVIYQLICEKYYGDDVEVTCSNLESTPEAELVVQKRATEWNIYVMISYLLPATFAGLFFGAWGDQHGRKLNIMIGFTGTIIGTYGYLLTIADRSIPLYVTPITGFVSGLSGYIGIIPISCIAFIADSNTDEKMLSFRMIMYGICMTLGGAVGGSLVSSATKALSIAGIGCLGMGIMTVGFFYTLLRVPQMPPMVLKQWCLAKNRKHATLEGSSFHSDTENCAFIDGNSSAPKQTEIYGIWATVKYAFKLQKEAVKACLKSRDDNIRAVLLLCGLVYFIHMSLKVGLHGVIQLYTFKTPLSWTPSDLGTYAAFSMIISLVGNFFGLFFLKQYLELTDSAVLIITMALVVARQIIISFARYWWMMYLAEFIGAVSFVSGPLIKSLVCKIIMKDEVGKVLAMFGMALDCGTAAGAILYNEIYENTVDIYAGTAFLFAAGEQLFCVAIMLWVHVTLKGKKQ